MYEEHFPHKRYKHTLEFLQKIQPKPTRILDLGVRNPFSEVMEKQGHQVINTEGEDLDDNFSAVLNENVELVTAFEIFEHLLSPYTLLKAIKAKKLIASVPLNLWFAKAYQSKTDTRDRHYHEFEDWQFNWLLEKTGWKIIQTEKWANPVNKIGIRPVLRKFTPRYYIVYAERK
ncbi:MAG: methyltransferase domain-containing protein [Mesonia hippocampi]|uniref:methyltransferase domain-containing protein n=1 Tax=Mesonia hippocampi TaxID=1628250 RepID=UPI003F969972